MISDLIASLAVGLVCLASAVLIVGCVVEPTFADRCQHCGEYFDDAWSAHQHLRECQPCR